MAQQIKDRKVYEMILSLEAGQRLDEALIVHYLAQQDYWLDVYQATRDECVEELCCSQLSKISEELEDLGYYDCDES